MAQQFPAQLMAVPLLAVLFTGVATAMDSRIAVNAGVERDSLSSAACVTVSSLNSETKWIDAPGVPGAQFSIVWNPQFQTHDILWANRTSRPLALQFATDSVADGEARVSRRALGPLETESLPGATVIPSRITKDVCVRMVIRS